MSTPRTDRVLAIQHNWGRLEPDDGVTAQEAYESMVLALEDLARTLERELASANTSLAFKSAQVDRIVVEEAAATKAAKERAKKAEAALAAAKQDAERYRWIRAEAAVSVEDEDMSDAGKHAWSFLLEGGKDPDEMDAAIDAARSANELT